MNFFYTSTVALLLDLNILLENLGQFEWFLLPLLPLLSLKIDSILFIFLFFSILFVYTITVSQALRNNISFRLTSCHVPTCIGGSLDGNVVFGVRWDILEMSMRDNILVMVAFTRIKMRIMIIIVLADDVLMVGCALNNVSLGRMLDFNIFSHIRDGVGTKVGDNAVVIRRVRAPYWTSE